MPRYERTPQTHGPGCWRWSNHWQCAVGLVDELADTVSALIEDLEQLRDGFQDWDQYLEDIAAADELVVRVRTKSPRNTAPPVPPPFSFGKRHAR